MGLIAVPAAQGSLDSNGVNTRQELRPVTDTREAFDKCQLKTLSGAFQSPHGITTGWFPPQS